MRPSRLPAKDARALRLDYYRMFTEGPQPTIAVIQDIDDIPGYGAHWGEVNSAIHKGLGCLGCVTNGSMRDLDVLAEGFQICAGVVGPSHAFVHVEQIGVTVNIHGMQVAPGDLIHADVHGAVAFDVKLVDDILKAIDLLTRREARILDAARAPGFNIDKLTQAMADADEIPEPWMTPPSPWPPARPCTSATTRPSGSASPSTRYGRATRSCRCWWATTWSTAMPSATAG